MDNSINPPSFMDKVMKRVDVLMFDGCNLLDVAGLVQAFSEAQTQGLPAYQLRFVSVNGGAPVKSSCGLRLRPDAKASVRSAATELVVPGGPGVDAALGSRDIVRLVRDWNAVRPARRVLAICDGAMLAAKAGLLDGRVATTHWSRGGEVKQAFPQVDWQIDRIYVRDERVSTSAGATAAIDLALAEIRVHCGAPAALAVARALLVHLKRIGGQTQYSGLLRFQLGSGGRLGGVMAEVIRQPGKPWTTETMATVASSTPRTLTRQFKQELGMTPVKFVEQVRVRLSSQLISTGMPVAKAVSTFGFGDAQRMQRAFRRQLGMTTGEFQARFA